MIKFFVKSQKLIVSDQRQTFWMTIVLFVSTFYTLCRFICLINIWTTSVWIIAITSRLFKFNTCLWLTRSILTIFNNGWRLDLFQWRFFVLHVAKSFLVIVIRNDKWFLFLLWKIFGQRVVNYLHCFFLIQTSLVCLDFMKNWIHLWFVLFLV